MDIHFLDILVYLIGFVIIWFCLPEDYREELGSVVGLIVLAVYTIIYVVLFAFIDYNIVDLPAVLDINLTL